MTRQTIELRSEKSINFIKVAGGALAIAAAAQMSIPMNPVPITFQTIAIMIIGLTYEPRLAMNTMVTYLVAGAAGLPVFSHFSGGLPYMMGPTGGYLVGFFVTPIIMAYFQQSRESSAISTLCNCMLGSLVIYALGVIWLSHFIGFEKAFYSGFVIFIPTGIAKIAALTGIMRFIRK